MASKTFLSDVNVTGGDLDVAGNLSANTIDSGTWTITIGDGTNSFTGTTQVGEYQRIGKMVFISGRISWTGKGSASGGIRLNLPLVCGSDRGMVTLGYTQNIFFTGFIVCSANAGQSYIVFRDVISGSNPVSLTNTAFGTTGEVQFQMNYFTT